MNAGRCSTWFRDFPLGPSGPDVWEVLKMSKKFVKTRDKEVRREYFGFLQDFFEYLHILLYKSQNSLSHP